MDHSRASLIVAAVLLTAACASQTPAVDPVEAARQRIVAEQHAEEEAKRVCRELGVPTDSKCLKDIASARMGTGNTITLPSFGGLLK